MTDIVEPDAPHRTLLRFPEARPDVHVSIAPDWRYTEVTPDAAEQLGRTADQMIGRTIWTLFPGLEASAMGALLRTCMASFAPSSPPVTVRLPVMVDGIERDTCATIRPERRQPGGLYIEFRWASVIVSEKYG